MLTDTPLLIFFSFIFCMLVVPALWSVAFDIGLTDRPSVRKLHTGEIPLIGGIAIYFGCVLTGIVFDHHSPVIQFLILAAPLIIVGLLDDIYDVHFVLRVIVQISVSIGMMHLCGIRIDQIGDIFGRGEFMLGPVFSPLFTIICVIGVINAINMMDGCDGLVGSISLVTFLTLAAMAGMTGDSVNLAICTMMSGALIAFLLFNTHVFGKRFRIFLGDTGSMFIGYALVWLFISLSQGEGSIKLSPIAAGWILGLPLVDVVSVIFGRIRKRVSPFSAGRDHIHHLLLDSGYSTQSSTVILTLVHAVFVFCGLLINQFTHVAPIAFWVFVLIVIAHHLWTPALIQHVKAAQIRI